LLDVFRQEPPPADHPFWATEGVIVLPHIDGPHPQRHQIVARLFELSAGAESTIQLRSTMRSSFLLRLHDSTRNTINMTRPRPEKASVISFCDTWPKA